MNDRRTQRVLIVLFALALGACEGAAKQPLEPPRDVAARTPAPSSEGAPGLSTAAAPPQPTASTPPEPGQPLAATGAPRIALGTLRVVEGEVAVEAAARFFEREAVPLRQCYEAALEADPALGALQLVVRLSVLGDGSTSAIELEPAPPEALERCLRERVAAMRFIRIGLEEDSARLELPVVLEREARP